MYIKMLMSKSVCALLLLITINFAACCPRAPTHLPHGRRTRGDNGYKLIVADGPNGYVPGKTYNCKFVNILLKVFNKKQNRI